LVEASEDMFSGDVQTFGLDFNSTTPTNPANSYEVGKRIW